MKRSLFFTIVMLIFSSMMGQKGAPSLNLMPTFKGERLLFEQAYAYGGDSVVFSKLRFYISEITLWANGEEVWAEKKSYHLLDLAEPNSLVIGLKAGLQFDEIRFQLGIDSATNVSGAMGGDLDPTKGMYWSWNTGYINFKLEGKSPLASSPKQRFVYHLGGYLPPFASVQKVQLACEPQAEILLGLDLYPFLQAVELGEQPLLMSPGEQCVQLSATVASLFKIIADE
ncbi:MAG: MbnP family protein [Bacteroidota bacterium]